MHRLYVHVSCPNFVQNTKIMVSLNDYTLTPLKNIVADFQMGIHLMNVKPLPLYRVQNRNGIAFNSKLKSGITGYMLLVTRTTHFSI